MARVETDITCSGAHPLSSLSQACKEIEQADAAQTEALIAQLRAGPGEAAMKELHRVRLFLDRINEQVRLEPGGTSTSMSD